jgi:hypothetical protein
LFKIKEEAPRTSLLAKLRNKNRHETGAASRDFQRFPVSLRYLTTVIGDYAHPKVRLPGSGGACEIAILAKRIFVITPQSMRSFPERVNFITSSGFLDGGETRRKLGIPGTGPSRVITNLGDHEFRIL